LNCFPGGLESLKLFFFLKQYLMKRLLLLFFFCWCAVICCFAQGQVHPNRISPLPVAQINGEELKIDLGGSWQFNPKPEKDFYGNTVLPSNWQAIEVPGEWAMQGFTVEKNEWAGYLRQFQIPQSWIGKRIKLRCDGVYSEAEIFINGKSIASHLGGFTPFETDISKFVQPGQQSIIAVKVKNESIADSLASGSQYAVHPLGGITRKIALIALPTINFSELQVVTKFDSLYKNVILTASIGLRNEGNKSGNIRLLFELFKPRSTEKIFSKETAVEKISAATSITKSLDFLIDNPLKWDPEHPNLYLIKVKLLEGDAVLETSERTVGFRQIEVRGNRVLVNNQPVKLRGVCRHETSPLHGRSLRGNQWAEDIKIFREGNVNYIRTSHYPPPEEFINACDSLGMFVEVEAPFCWAERTNVPEQLFQPALVQQTLDMVNFFRSNPSVLIWSVGNESLKYKEYFKKTAQLVKELDPSRPRIFSQYTPDGDDGDLEIGNHHYPGPTGPEKYANSKRPIVFDEYCHLNTYNRSELVTDPGVRDAWGIGFSAMWEKMQATPSILGGALWAGIDDAFFLPDGRTVGYGSWGPIDGWRRQKPEYWHIKKAYSPVKIRVMGNWNNGVFNLIIENRLLFSNLNECAIRWKTGNDSGIISANAKPGITDTIGLKIARPPAPTDVLQIAVYDPRSVWIDEYVFQNLVPEVVLSNSTSIKKAQGWKYRKKDNMLTVQAGAFEIRLNSSDGAIVNISRKGKQILSNDARLMVLPLNSIVTNMQMTGDAEQFKPYTDNCHNRTIRKVQLDLGKKEFSVVVLDEYDEAKGKTIYRFRSDGNIKVSYRYQVKKEINPRQWGMVFTLPSSFTQLKWKRQGVWNYYPNDHIGRLQGTANAVTETRLSEVAGPSWKPTQPWFNDRNRLGSNDFRSTKMNIENASLSDNGSSAKILSNAEQHIRSWLDGNTVKMLVAKYSNIGGEPFFREHAQKMEKPLKPGDIIEDEIKIIIE
jgi:beta-galactosidase